MAVIPASDVEQIVAFPPFDATTFASQLFWFAIVFTTLYLFMSRFVVPRVGGIIEDRRARIAKDLADAEQMQARAQAAAEAHEKSLNEARGSAQKIAQDERNRLNAAADARRKTLEADLAAKLATAEKNVADMKARAMANVESVATDAATAIVEKLTGSAPRGDAVASAIKSALVR